MSSTIYVMTFNAVQKSLRVGVASTTLLARLMMRRIKGCSSRGCRCPLLLSGALTVVEV